MRGIAVGGHDVGQAVLIEIGERHASGAADRDDAEAGVVHEHFFPGDVGFVDSLSVGVAGFNRGRGIVAASDDESEGQEDQGTHDCSLR